MRVLRWVGRVWTGMLLVTVVAILLLIGLRLLLPLPFLSSPPQLVRSTPANQATHVIARVRPSVSFNVPMNRPSVERALRLDPPAPIILLWGDDDTTLTISPTASLQPDTTYQLVIASTATSRLFRMLAAPIALTFHTESAPAVVAVLPPNDAKNVPLTTTIGLRFSRPMVSAAILAQPTAMPSLHFDPPLEGRVTWLDPFSLIFRPTTPLQANTHYQATLTADFADLSGSQLGTSFGWTFSTDGPRILAVTPPDQARFVAPRASLVLTISQPLAMESIRASLVISPTNTGLLTATVRLDATQVITYTPSTDWEPNTTYNVALLAGAAPVSGTIPLLEMMNWTFTTAPLPILTGRFPGEGQILPPGQDIRLIFTTPIDEAALRAALRFVPPVATAQVTTRDSEVHITADLRASTVYTLTLPATIPDRNGMILGQAYHMRFVTAPAPSALIAPDAIGHSVQIIPSTNTSLMLRRTNLSALNLDLYRLDEATMVRLLAFQERDWTDFQPDRYAQTLLRSWSVNLADPLDTPIAEPLSLVDAAGRALESGAYYLRIRTPEGAHADLLTLVSHTRLSLQVQGAHVLAWATDVRNVSPLAGIAITLYQDGVELARGSTDVDGVWQPPPLRSGTLSGLVALVGGDNPSTTSVLWGTAAGPPLPTHILLTTERAIYQPAEQVALAGFIRSAASSTPSAATSLSLTVRRIGAATPVVRETVVVQASGVISTSFLIPHDAESGDYLIEATSAQAQAQARFRVRDPLRPTLDARIAAPSHAIAGDDVPITITVGTSEGLPAASAIVSWTIEATPEPFPEHDGYTFGDDERSLDHPPARMGQGLTDADGRLTLVISATIASATPVRYHIAAHIHEMSGLSTTVDSGVLVFPAERAAGLHLPQRIFMVDRPGTIDFLTRTAEGTIAPDATIDVELYRRTWVRSNRPDSDNGGRLTMREERVILRRLRTTADGRAELTLALRRGGEYRVRVLISDQKGQRRSSAESLWVAETGVTSWRETSDGRIALITDRAAYQPGDIVTLLPLLTDAETPALLTIGHTDGLEERRLRLRAGEPITITIRPNDRANLPVLLVVPIPHRGTSVVTPAFHTAATTLDVRDPRGALTVAITTDQKTYALGATAIVTVTTRDEHGKGIPAAVLLDIVDAPVAPYENGAEPVREHPSPLVGAPPQATAVSPRVLWNPYLQTSAEGVLTLTVPLPQEPIVAQALVWAVDAQRSGQAHATLSVTRPLDLSVAAPPFFRVDDTVAVIATIHNASTITQTARVTLATGGVEPRSATPPNRQITIAAGQTTQVQWDLLVRPVLHASLSIRIEGNQGTRQTFRLARPILPSGATIITGAAALVTDRWSQHIVLPDDPATTWEQLDIDIAPSSAALAHTIIQRLAARTDRSLLDEASLLLLSAPFSDTRTLAQATLDRIIAAQARDGGWGWWAPRDADPFVSAVMLEALARARQAGLSFPPTLIDQTASVLRQHSFDADMRAYRLYVLSQHNLTDAQALRDLTTDRDSLSAEGISALLLMHDGPSSPTDSALLLRLEHLAIREGDRVHWSASTDTVLLGSHTSATALAILALEHMHAGPELIAGAHRWLAATRSPQGWPSAYQSARALIALQSATIAAPATTQTTLNTTALFSGTQSAVITQTQHISLTLEQPQNDLTIVSDKAPIFAAYQLVRATTQLSPTVAPIALAHDLLDPQTGQPLDRTHVRLGQLLRVRLTIVAFTPQRLTTIVAPLPAGGVLVARGANDAFDNATTAPDHLTVSSARLRPGIYEYTYWLRAIVPGHFSIPTPFALLGDGQRNPDNTPPSAIDIQP